MNIELFIEGVKEFIICNRVRLLVYIEILINKIFLIKILRVSLKEEDLFIKFVNNIL